MSSSALIKPALLVSGIGTIGIGGINVIRWQSFEINNPTVDSLLNEQGLFWNPISQYSDWKFHDSEDKSARRIDWSKWGCFSRMFPGIEINSEEPKEIVDWKLVNPTTPPENPESASPVACAIMDLNPVWTRKGIDFFWHFKSELVVKGEDSAVALWVGLSNLPNNLREKKERSQNSRESNEETGNSKRGKKHKKEKKEDSRFSDAFVYRVVSLKKDNNQWSVVDGYQWNNYSGKYENSHDKGGFYIKPPGVEDDWLKEKKFSSRDYVRPRQWMGIWEVSEDDGEVHSLLSDIHVFRYSQWYAEILGRRSKDSEHFFSAKVVNSDTSQPGYTKAKAYYDSSKGWVKYSDEDQSSDISLWLDGWYKPFMNKRGKWTDLYTRCNSLSRERNHRDASVERLKHLCYYKP